MNFLRNAWYAAAWYDELATGDFLARKILGEDVVLFRGPQGDAGALSDRCPHRFAPLSNGKLRDGAIQCGYHGLTFNSSGQCVFNPAGPVPGNARVTSYPVIQKHSVIWIWMGDAVLVDESKIPDFEYVAAAKPTSIVRGYTPVAANYELIIDNLTDLSHVDHLHPTTLGSDATSWPKPSVTEEGDTVRIVWANPNRKVGPLFDPFLSTPGHPVDHHMEIRWDAPALIKLHTHMTPKGRSIDHSLQIIGSHMITPETDTSSHYFYTSARNFHVDDAELNELRRQAYLQAFGREDRPMIEDVQRRMGTTDLLSLRPVMLPADAGATRVRRVLKRLIERELEAESANADASTLRMPESVGSR